MGDGGRGRGITIIIIIPIPLHCNSNYDWSSSPTGIYFVVRGCAVALTHLSTDVSRSRFSAFPNSASTLLTAKIV